MLHTWLEGPFNALSDDILVNKISRLIRSRRSKIREHLKRIRAMCVVNSRREKCRFVEKRGFLPIMKIGLINIQNYLRQIVKHVNTRLLAQKLG